MKARLRMHGVVLKYTHLQDNRVITTSISAHIKIHIKIS